MTWSHICELIKIDDELERSFYEKECYKEKWDVRTLRRQMDSALFLRLATSRDKEGILALAREGITYEKPEDGYEVIVDLPGFKKDEVKVALKDGYLTVSAAKGLDEDDEDKKGHYIRRERYAGACERSFYVGEEVTQEDIKGEYKHGILKLFVPKKEAKPVSNDPKYITIE